MSVPLLQVPRFVNDFFRRAPGGRRRLVGLTYRLNASAFEHHFSQVLSKPIQVDVVCGEPATTTNARYRIWPANWHGTFHPKVLLMMANDRVAVGLGSANLTPEGIAENLESWSFFDHSDDSPVLRGVRHLLERLLEMDVVPDQLDLAEFSACLPESVEPSALLSTLDGRLFDQVISRLPGSVRRLDIVSPISTDPTDLISAMRQHLSLSDVRLFTDAPAAEIAGVDTYWAPRAKGQVARKLAKVHSKLFAFQTGDRVDLFWGSANLSCAAWLCSGKNANVDLLVHSQVSAKEWWAFLRCLPDKHKWVTVTPRPLTLPVDDRNTGRWRLLYGILEDGELRLRASGSGIIDLRLRTAFRSVTVRLEFRHEECVLERKLSIWLGFHGPDAPTVLEWRVTSDTWRSVPVNHLDSTVNGSDSNSDLAGTLFQAYAGRPLPMKSRGTPTRTGANGGPGFDEEKELTRSLHQGELDKFVLRWRLVAKALSAASKDNSDVRKHRVADALKRIGREAHVRPECWPTYRRQFVQELLEGSWRV